MKENHLPEADMCQVLYKWEVGIVLRASAGVSPALKKLRVQWGNKVQK